MRFTRYAPGPGRHALTWASPAGEGRGRCCSARSVAFGEPRWGYAGRCIALRALWLSSGVGAGAPASSSSGVGTSWASRACWSSAGWEAKASPQRSQRRRPDWLRPSAGIATRCAECRWSSSSCHVANCASHRVQRKSPGVSILYLPGPALAPAGAVPEGRGNRRRRGRKRPAALLAAGWVPALGHRVEGPPFVQHRHHRGEPPRPRLGALGVAQTVEDGVAVLAVQPGEERGRGRVGVERLAQVVGHRRLALRLVGGGPAAVGLRRLDLRQAGRLHPARADQRLDLRDVDLRPTTLRAAWRELLQEERFVQRVAL